MRRIFFLLGGLAWLAAAAAAPASTFLDRPLGQWLSDLEKNRPAQRRSAAFALGRMGALAVFAVPDLAKRIDGDRDASVRDMAASSLGDIVLSLKHYPPTEQWKTAGEVLEKALTHEDPRVRRSAAYALGAFGELAAPAVPALKKKLSDPSPAVRQNAAWALGRVGPGIDAAGVAALCGLLKDPQTLVRRDAAAALGSLGNSAGRATIRPAGTSLLDLLKKEADEVVRRTALDALATLAGPEHREQAEELVPLLKSKDEETAYRAAFVLGSVGGEPALKALPVLRKALASHDSSVQSLAAVALARAGKDAASAVDALARALTLSKNPEVRRNCCIALAHIGPRARPAIAAIVEALKPVKGAPDHSARARPYEEVREQAAEALAQIGYPDNAAAMPAIREAIARDKNPEVRQRCVWALFDVEDLDKVGMTKVLTDVLDEKDADNVMVRYDSARVLAHKLEERAPDRTVELLLEMLEDRKLRVFNKTDASIEGTGNEAGPGSSAIARDLGGDARYMAAMALGWMKEKSRRNARVMKALREAAKEVKEPRLQKEATKALERLGAKP